MPTGTKSKQNIFFFKDYSVLQSFQSQISTVQRDAVWFFHVKVTKMYMVGERDFVLG